MQTKEWSVTISSININHPGTVVGPSEVPPQDAREVFAVKTAEIGTLQEVTDQAKLSVLAPRIQSLFREIAGSGGNVLETLSGNIEKLQDGFVETLYSVLSKENIDLSQKMTLRLDGDNNLAVAGDHPEKDRVNVMLANQPALSSAFGEIASQSEVLRDMTNINKVITRHTGMDAYAVSGRAQSVLSIYQMSLKGDMSHFYFSRP